MKLTINWGSYPIEFDVPPFDTSNHQFMDVLQQFAEQWTFEFDTIQNRELMNNQLRELITSYISQTRDEKINTILNDKDGLGE